MVQEFNWIDTIVYLILALSTLLGMWRGLFSSLFGIIALVLSIVIARDFAFLLEPFLRPIFGQSPLLPGGSVLLLFTFTFVLLGLGARLLSATLHKYDVGGLNLLGGGVFGVLRGSILITLFVLLLSAIGIPQTTAWGTAKTVPLVGAILQATMQIPLIAPYRNWLHFDQDGRPAVRDGSQQVQGETGEEEESGEDEKSELEQVLTKAELIAQTRSEREKEYNKAVEGLVNHTVISDAPAPPPQEQGYSEDAGGDFRAKAGLARLLCVLGGRENCRQKE